MNHIWFSLACLLCIALVRSGPPGKCYYDGKAYNVGGKARNEVCYGDNINTYEKECLQDLSWSEAVVVNTVTCDADETCDYAIRNGAPFCKTRSDPFYTAKNEPARIDGAIFDTHDSPNWEWIGLNVMISVVTSLCVIALCLTSYYAMKSLANQGKQFQAVQCDDDDV
eukprot:272771_1